MNITVNDLSTVDKEIEITATREDLEPKFNSALKKYRSKISIPGFRPGMAPMGIVKKRFGKDIEKEEAYNYVLDLFETDIKTQFDLIGQPEILTVNWENDSLEAKIKVGISPDFELIELSNISIDKMVHDVTDEEVQEELDLLLIREGTWEETDEAATEEHKVTVDVVGLDEEGNEIENDTDEDYEINLKEDENLEFKEALLGKNSGDIVTVEVEHGDHKHRYQLTVKKVEKNNKAELTDELTEKMTNGEIKKYEEYASFLKSKIQEYYDRTSSDMAKNQLMEKMVDTHEFEIPDTLKEILMHRYVDEMKQKHNIDVEVNIDAFRDSFNNRAVKDGKWYFINEKLKESFKDIEVDEKDLDLYFENMSAQYGMLTHLIKDALVSKPDQVEHYKMQIREEKVLDKALEGITINELNKEEYEMKYEKKDKATND